MKQVSSTDNVAVLGRGVSGNSSANVWEGPDDDDESANKGPYVGDCCETVACTSNTVQQVKQAQEQL